MVRDLDLERQMEDAQKRLHDAVQNAFCAVMRESQLPPMTVLGLAALAVGSTYKNAAIGHCGPTCCPCGWTPCEAGDLKDLQIALASAARSSFLRRPSLHDVAGNA